MKSIFLTLMLLVAIAICSCKKNEEDSLGLGKVKLVNTVKGSNPQSFFQNDQQISTATLSYGEVSDFLTVKGGVNKVSFRDAVTGSINAESNGGLLNGDSYTLFYYSTTKGTGAIKGIQNDNALPPPGKVKIRFVNFGYIFANTLNINLANGSALVTGLAYFNYSNYITIDANSSLSVSVLNTNKEELIPASAFATGKVYLVWFDAIDNFTVNYHIFQQN